MRRLVVAAAALALAGTPTRAEGVTTGTSCDTVRGERACAFDIRISGAITEATPAALRRAVAERAEMMRREGEQNDWWMIHIDSGGGNVTAAIEVGRLLRMLDAPIEVDPEQLCASACVLVFAGATHRLAHGQIGIHRPYVDLDIIGEISTFSMDPYSTPIARRR